MLPQLRHVEDIVDPLEPALEVKPVGRLPYVLQHPEWSNKPIFKLPYCLQGEGYSKRAALLLLLDTPTAYDTCQTSASGSLVLSSSGFWHPGLVSGCTELSELHQAYYSGFPQ